MSKGVWIAAFAIGIYLAGGIGAFLGIGLIVLMEGRDFFGWGEGRSLGYLFLGVGLGLSILGVLIMRILRNRIS